MMRIHQNLVSSATDYRPKRAARLRLALLLAVIALCITGIANAARDHLEDYLDMVAENEAMVQCLNGRTVGIGDAVLRCDVRALTPTLSRGEREFQTEVQP
jgi:hypothetical protein